MSTYYSWLQHNDLPNWISAAFTAVFWPLVLFWWSRRTVNSIPNLQVIFSPTTIAINGQTYSAIDITFLNTTQSVVYLTTATLRNCTGNFVVPPAAIRNIGNNSHELKFLDPGGGYTLREFTLHTNSAAKTCMAVANPPSKDFYAHKSCFWRHHLGLHKYFRIEYTAMVKDKRFKVSTVY